MFEFAHTESASIKTGSSATEEQTYSLSARTTLYALQAYQHARGKALITTGSGATSIADAVAVVGDSQNTTPSSGPSQLVGMVGLRHAF